MCGFHRPRSWLWLSALAALLLASCAARDVIEWGGSREVRLHYKFPSAVRETELSALVSTRHATNLVRGRVTGFPELGEVTLRVVEVEEAAGTAAVSARFTSPYVHDHREDGTLFGGSFYTDDMQTLRALGEILDAIVEYCDWQCVSIGGERTNTPTVGIDNHGHCGLFLATDRGVRNAK